MWAALSAVIPAILNALGASGAGSNLVSALPALVGSIAGGGKKEEKGDEEEEWLKVARQQAENTKVSEQLTLYHTPFRKRFIE